MKALRILIIEDHSLTAFDIRQTLERAGHHVTAIARNFQEAIDTARKEWPDLAIVDIMLEGDSEDGITTTRELLKQNWMPIIYLTANSETPMFQRAVETVPAAYLLKPFRQNELAFQVELAYLNQRRSHYQGSMPDQDSLFLPLNKGLDRISRRDVLYMQANGAYVKLYLVEQEKPQLLTMNLGHLAQYFAMPDFFRMSRSLLINLKHVSRIEGSHLFLDDNRISLLIPEGSRSELMNKLTIVRTR